MERPQKPAAPPTDYVGSQACVECHREISETYFAHPMGRASGPLAEVPPIEQYGSQAQFDSTDGCRYVVDGEPDQIHHHEVLPAPEGEPLYDQAVAMELSIGSGRRGRSYGYRRGERYFMSPIGWYTGKSCWDLSPGYLPGRHQRFDRLLTERCLGCHVGRMTAGPAPDTWAAESSILEHRIGCERCHGPGASHVEKYRQASPGPEFADRIVNPAKLDAVRRDAVCHQCHLQAGKTIPRSGRRVHDFRPGDRISDIWVVLPGAAGERRSVTQSEQMVASRCYQASNGRMGCISCHDPHSLPQGDPAASFDPKCVKCHGEGQTPCAIPAEKRVAQTCIGCHMPRFAASNVPHTALTDHRILRKPGSTQTEKTPARAVAFDEGEPPVPDWEVRRAQAVVLRTDSRLIRSDLDLQRAAASLRELEPLLPDDPELWETQAWIASRRGQWKDVEAAARKALALAPERFDARELLIGALADRQAWSEVATECETLLARDPGKALYHKLRAEAAWHQGDIEGGLQAAERALDCDPTLWDLRRRLADGYSQLGEHEKAAAHRRVLDLRPNASSTP